MKFTGNTKNPISNFIAHEVRYKLLFILLTIFAFVSHDLSELLKVKARHEFERNEILDAKADYIFKDILPMYQGEAIKQAEVMRKQAVEDLLAVYEGNMEQLKEDMDFQIFRTDFTPFLEVVSGITNRNVFKGITGDKKGNNDANALNEEGVLADNSKNCATYGPIRTWINEFKMHWNKFLVKLVPNDLFKRDRDKTFWMFLKPAKSLPFKLKADLKLFNSTEFEDLRALFIKHDGDMRIFNYIEFLNVAHVFRYHDIFGTPAVSPGGLAQDTSIFVMNQPFVLGDALEVEEDKRYLITIKGYNDSLKKLDLEFAEAKYPVIMRILGQVAMAFIIFIFIPLKTPERKE